jgi:hypothetical protein
MALFPHSLTSMSLVSPFPLVPPRPPVRSLRRERLAFSGTGNHRLRTDFETNHRVSHGVSVPSGVYGAGGRALGGDETQANMLRGAAGTYGLGLGWEGIWIEGAPPSGLVDLLVLVLVYNVTLRDTLQFFF